MAQAQAQSQDLRVLERCHISPPPGATPTQASLPVTFAEIIFLYASPVERVFFFRLPPSTAESFLDCAIPVLKSSLSLTLARFFPLAGKLRPSPDSTDHRYEIHYTAGDAVSLIVAECDDDLDDLCAHHPRSLVRMLPLVPELGTSGEVLALQATLFPGRGVAIGVSAHHSACDGSSSTHFLATWAAACRSGGAALALMPPPVFDKSLLPDPRGILSIFVDFLMKLRSDPLPRSAQDDAIKLCASFVLTKDDIKRLQETVLTQTDDGKAVALYCSTTVVLYAFVWTCLVRARILGGGEKAYLAFAADFRGRTSPPLQAGYFGSCVGPCFVEVNAGAIAEEGSEGFVAACAAVGKAIEELKSDFFKGAEGWMEKLTHFAQQQPMSVAGSPRFKVYDMDFGWGRPEKVEVISIRITRAISVAENRAGEQGGVEIGLVLPEDELIAFGKCFSGGLQATARRDS